MPFGTKQFKKAQWLTKHWSMLIDNLPTHKTLGEDGYPVGASVEQQLKSFRSDLRAIDPEYGIRRDLHDPEMVQILEEFIEFLEIEMQKRGFNKDEPHAPLSLEEHERMRSVKHFLPLN